MTCGDTFQFIEEFLKKTQSRGTEEYTIINNALEEYVTNVLKLQISKAGSDASRLGYMSDAYAKILAAEEKQKLKTSPQSYLISEQDKINKIYNDSIKQWREQLPVKSVNPTLQSQYSDTSNLRAVTTTGGGTTLTQANYVHVNYIGTTWGGNTISWKAFDGGWVWKGEYELDSSTGKYEPKIVYDPNYSLYLKLEEEKKKKQKYIKDQVGNINTYPLCIRNIPTMKIESVIDKNTGNIFYFAHSNKEYPNLAFNRDEGEFPVGGYYFTYKTQLSRDYKSGQYVCVNNDIILNPTPTEKEVAKSLLGEIVRGSTSNIFKDLDRTSAVPTIAAALPASVPTTPVSTSKPKEKEKESYTNIELETRKRAMKLQEDLLEEKKQSGLNYLKLLILHEIAGITTYQNEFLYTLDILPYQNLKSKNQIPQFITDTCNNLIEKYKTLCITKSYEGYKLLTIPNILKEAYNNTPRVKKGGYFLKWNEYDKVWEKDWGLRIDEAIGLMAGLAANVIGWAQIIASFIPGAGSVVVGITQELKLTLEGISIMANNYVDAKLRPTNDQNWGYFWGQAIIFGLITKMKVFDEIQEKMGLSSQIFESIINPNYRQNPLKYYTLLGIKFSANRSKFLQETLVGNADVFLQMGLGSLYRSGVTAAFDLTETDKNTARILDEFKVNIGLEFQTWFNTTANVLNVNTNLFETKSLFEKKMVEVIKESQQFGTPYKSFSLAEKFCEKNIAEFYIPSPEFLLKIENKK